MPKGLNEVHLILNNEFLGRDIIAEHSSLNCCNVSASFLQIKQKKKYCATNQSYEKKRNMESQCNLHFLNKYMHKSTYEN